MREFDRPFLGSQALDRKALSRHDLRMDYRRLYRDVYVHKTAQIDAKVRAEAALLFGGPHAVLGGFSAAAVHGTRWIPDDEPAEIVRRGHSAAPAGITIRVDRLEPREIDTARRATTPARTAFDLGRRLPRARAIATIDALVNATGLRVADVEEVAVRHPGARGLLQLRELLPFVDGGAESPPETYTRLLLVENGLPRPETQIVVRDEYGSVVARADLGWRRRRVLVEYDGEQHWTDRRQRARDIDRSADLERLGWTIVRVGADLLRRRPHVVLQRVRAALAAEPRVADDWSRETPA